jgi:hypothetical protein
MASVVLELTIKIWAAVLPLIATVYIPLLGQTIPVTQSG